MKTNEHLAGTEGETGAQPYRLVGKWVIARGAGEFLADCFFGDKDAREASEHAATLLAACNSHAANLARIAELEEVLQDAEFLLRKTGINWKEASSMRDSFLRCARDAHSILSRGIK